MSANEYEVGCPMPGCGEPLAITWFLSYGLHPTDVALDPDPEVVDARIVPAPDWHHVSSYEIGCINGHVLVLPPDTAEDSYDLDADAIERLRALIEALAGVPAPRCERCGHHPHAPGACLNLASDNDCSCGGS